MLTGLKLQTALNYFKFGRDDTPSASVENSSIYVNKITLYCANRVKITNSSELFQVWGGGGWDTSSSSLENPLNYVKITLYCDNRVKITNISELFQVWGGGWDTSSSSLENPLKGFFHFRAPCHQPQSEGREIEGDFKDYLSAIWNHSPSFVFVCVCVCVRVFCHNLSLTNYKVIQTKVFSMIFGQFAVCKDFLGYSWAFVNIKLRCIAGSIGNNNIFIIIILLPNT